MAQPYDPIFLDVTLWDGAEDRYVRAWVRANGILQPYSPVELDHVGQGQYLKAGTNIFFPEDIQHLSIVYEIFSDDNFTIKSKRHATVSEHYVLDQPPPPSQTDPELFDKLNEIISLILSHDINSQLKGEIMDAFSLDGYVIETDVLGVIAGSDEITGNVLPEDFISGTISEDDTVDGFFEL